MPAATILPVTLVPPALLAVLLLAGVRSDLRSRTIGNRLNIAIALLAPAWWWAQGLSLWPDVAWQAGIALALFALFAGAFALGAMGGGDVKMIGAVALWLSPAQVAPFLVVMALAGGMLTLAMLAAHKAARRPGQPEIPYGVAIAAAAIWVMSNDILTSSGY